MQDVSALMVEIGVSILERLASTLVPTLTGREVYSSSREA
jgi:hypothetical protein